MNKEEYDVSKNYLLDDCGLTYISIGTAYNWMIAFGFKYKVRNKFYYVDSNEKEAEVKYRWRFVNRYL